MSLSKTNIIIEPLNGLCNRLRALDSALALAEDCGCGLAVYWNSFFGMNCPLGRIIQVPEAIKHIWSWSTISRISRIERFFRIATIRAKFFDTIVDTDPIQSLSDEEKQKTIRSNHRVFISTSNRFYFSKTRKPYWWLKPAQPLMAAAENVMSSFSGRKVIGIHLRLVGHEKCRQSLQLDDVIQAMEKELAASGDILFFLTTDEPQTERSLVARFSSNVLIYQKRSRDRSLAEASEDAMVDLICLKSTSRILGSDLSSFAVTAAQWGEIPLFNIATQKTFG